MKIGDKVHYTPWKNCDESKIQNGIIKSFSNQTLNPFIVFHCAEDWDNYMNYTGQLTRIECVEEGWFDYSKQDYFI